jgi:hypothetical protein
MTTKKASKAGARRVTANLDALASLFQNHHASLGIPQKVAMDFAYRCDLLSDTIDRRKQAGYFNPAEIGEEQPGPLVYDENNPFMEGEFTREEFRALSEKQEAGELSDGIADPKLASLIRKAATEAARNALRMAKKSEEAPAKESEEEEVQDEAKKDEKAEKTAMMAQLYNRLRRQAKKSEEAPAKEADDDVEADDEDGEPAKTASLFGLYR